MKTLRTKWTGIRPLVMHSAAMVDQDNPHVRTKNELQRALKKMKKDDDEGRAKLRRRIERAEWEGSMYWSADVGLYCPGDNLFACIVAGAKRAKCGKQVEQALVPLKDAEILTACPTKDVEKLWKDTRFALRWAVRIPPKTGPRLMAVRPMVPTGWSIEFECEFDESIIPERDLLEAMQTSGSLIGLGDWRPKFGRFTIEIL